MPTSTNYLDDGVIGDSTDTNLICMVLNSPVANIPISYGINLFGGPVTARTFMSVWSKTSVSAANFQTATQTVTFKLGASVLPTQFTATGMNAVWTTGS